MMPSMSKLNRLSYNEKVKLANDVKDLNPTKLGEIVAVIKQSCPNAFKDIDGDNCQIVVDNIDKNTLEMINGKIFDTASNKRVKTK